MRWEGRWAGEEWELLQEQGLDRCSCSGLEGSVCGIFEKSRDYSIRSLSRYDYVLFDLSYSYR